ncbi:MAG: hypothetical protein Q7T71_07265, partial [Herbiconiux sp.]|nr:hypothetical protein [Herbiconiux sp.]
RSSLAALLGAERTPISFGKQVLNVMSLAVSGVTYSRHFLKLAELSQTGIIDTAVVDQQIALETHRIEQYRQLEHMLGVPAALLADPARRAELEGRAHDLVLELLKPHNRAVWQRDPHVLDNVLAAAGMNQAMLGAQVRPGSAGGASVPVIPSAPGGASARAIGTSSGRTGRAEDHELDLSIDARLRKAWLSAQNGASTLHGVGGASSGGSGTVIVVDDGWRPSQLVAETAVEALARALRVSRANVIVLTPSTLGDLVSDWFRRVIAEDELTTSISVFDDLLTISVDGPPRSARSAVASLNDPRRTELAALVELLAFSDVEVVVAEGEQ